MFTYLGGFTARRPWLVCAAWLVLGVVLSLLAPSWDSRAQDDDIRFLPERCPSVRGYQLLEKAFPQDVYASRVIFAVERPTGKLSDADLALVDALTADLNRLRQEEPALGIKKIVSHRDPFVGKRLVSEDGRCTLLQVSLATPYLALQTRATVDRAEAVVRGRLSEHEGDRPAVYTTGPAGVGRDLVAASGNGLESTTLATVVLVIVILLFVYRSPLLALVPLVTIALATWAALSILALCTLIPGFHLVNISQIFAVVMLYGAGTDYCLFLVSRYREELTAGGSRTNALARSVGGVGGALAASAATVICGLGLMLTAEFAKVRCGGPAIGIGLGVALLASLTLTPALLKICGKAAFWPFGKSQIPNHKFQTNPKSQAQNPKPEQARGRFGIWHLRFVWNLEFGIWDFLSRLVVARPLLIWSLALALLLPLAVIGLGVRPTYRATGELSPSSSSVQGLAAIQRHFTAGEVGPLTVLLESEIDWDSPRGRRIVEHLSKGFAHLPNVAEVRSLTQPLGKTPEEAPQPPPTGKNIRGSLFGAVWRNVVASVTDQIHKATRTFYAAKIQTSPGRATSVTRLDVVMHTDPFDPRSIPTLETIQFWLDEQLPKLAGPVGGARAEVHGVTVSSRDLAEVTESDRTRLNVLVLGAIFVILVVLVRRPLLAAYLLGTVVLSYLATLGATALLAHWWHARPLGEVDWRVPFFLFTILVAVGEDYNILLISRALEERRKHGGIEGTRRALAHTGGTITSCGLIMAGTFATLMLAGLNTLVQVGFALAFGVLLDTFVVRPFLVPAFTLWLWRNDPPAEEQKRAVRQAG
jgi:RND superfamily putative drug exporter